MTTCRSLTLGILANLGAVTTRTSALLAASAGAAGALGARALFVRLLLAKFRRDLKRLNEGDYRPLLAGYADDAVLVFNDGAHRWAGEHRGKAAIERFLQEFTGAGLRGELRDLHVAGPPWALTMMVRFDDSATGPDGEELYHNRVAMLVHTRRGKIVRHEDFYEDTSRIDALERRLTELGITPVAAGNPAWSG
jgi:ketosteroid isomerase-like protein